MIPSGATPASAGAEHPGPATGAPINSSAIKPSGDVHVGTIANVSGFRLIRMHRAGACGFYPSEHTSQQSGGAHAGIQGEPEGK